MTDKELLEFAAKSAGLQFDGLACKAIVQMDDELALLVRNDLGGNSIWNPLRSDGDALRLAAKLGMSVDMTLGKFVEASIIVDDKRISGICDCGPAPDYYAATRRAIVRAAAAIGKAMP